MTEELNGAYQLDGIEIVDNLNYQHTLMNLLGENEFRKLVPN